MTKATKVLWSTKENWKEKYQNEIKKEESKYFELVIAIYIYIYIYIQYIDGKKYFTLTMTEGENKKRYISTQLEEHQVIVGAPGEFCLSHFFLII